MSQPVRKVRVVFRLEITLLLGALAIAGCAPKRFIKTNADLGAITAVVVLPFENVTNDKLAAERVHRIFMTELLNRDAFRVVEPGEVGRVLRRDQLDPTSLTPAEMKRLGERLEAQALFMGAVLEYDEGRGGGSAPSPRVKLQFRLLDTETATTLWSVCRSRGGATISARLFGIGGEPASSLAEEIIRDELAELLR